MYSTQERENDIEKMKKYFEMTMSPMQRLASEPNGSRLISDFVLRHNSTHYYKKHRKFYEDPALRQLFLDLKSLPYDSEIVQESRKRQRTCSEPP